MAQAWVVYAIMQKMHSFAAATKIKVNCSNEKQNEIAGSPIILF